MVGFYFQILFLRQKSHHGAKMTLSYTAFYRNFLSTWTTGVHSPAWLIKLCFSKLPYYFSAISLDFPVSFQMNTGEPRETNTFS